MRAKFGQIGILFLGLLAISFILTRSTHSPPISREDRILAPYEQDLLSWELAHVFDKWWHKVRLPLWGGEENRITQSEAITYVLSAQSRNDPRAPQMSGADEKSRMSVASIAEEAIESAVNEAAKEQGLGSRRFNSVVWPPVDFTFSPRPLVLVTSPKHEIRRLKDTLLRFNIGVEEQEHLEAQIEGARDNKSALVVSVGGVATYPSQVPPGLSLDRTLETVAHEWMHHYLFFTPLGRLWFAGGALQSINESVADLAGQELANLAARKLVAPSVNRDDIQTGESVDLASPDTSTFNYHKEMRKTRTQLELLLSDGQLPEADAYLESQRLKFVRGGYHIRKLNTAFFAFHGTYGTSPAARSPIASQLKAVRASTVHLGEFLDLVSNIRSEEDLNILAMQVGWVPNPDD